ncbi:hypothetical protein [Aeromicrobium sp.]|uniref:hypothetical protein n=1 Tax=Aeromicrobium sp. TaxID=1871063 RepID=UPI003D6B010B
MGLPWGWSAVLVTVVGTAVLLVPQVANSVAPPPPEIQGSTTFTFDYFGSETIRGNRNVAANTIEVKDAQGNAVECEEPIPNNGLRFFECTPVDLYTSAELAGTSTVLSFHEVNADDESSAPTVVTINFAESRFQVTTPPSLPSGDTITLLGEREEFDVTVQWTLRRGSTDLLGEPQECVVDFPAGGGEGSAFSCTYDDRGTGRAEPSAAAMRPAMFTLPSVLPGGEYTATIEEYKPGVVPPIDTIEFVFNVAGPAPPNAPNPGAPGTPGAPTPLGDSTAPIPLAPPPGPGLLEPPQEPGSEPSPEPPADPPTPDEQDLALSPVPTSIDVLRILILAITAFTILSMVGPRGVAVPRRLASATAATGGPGPQSVSRGGAVAAVAAVGGGVVEGADDDAGRANLFGEAFGDRSMTWRFPGWPRLDVLSVAVPALLSTRLPLVARVLSDAAYLRASLGVLWVLLPICGMALGVVAALGGSAAPLPPALALTATLLVLAVLDSATGIAAVLAFAAVTVARGGLTADGLELGEGVRGLLGLGALWFVTPLVAAAARPLRRASEPGHVYGWDRFGDVVIAALLGGWAVQGIVGGLGDLTGKDLPITEHADALALLAIAAVVGRFGIEEVTATGYPRRLAAVEAVGVGEPATIHHLRGLAVRAALLAFFVGAFIGNCWQLWAGVTIFALPQLLALFGDRIPDLTRLAPAVPRGVTQVLVLVLVGTAIAYVLDSRAGNGSAEREAIRNGFVLLSIPAATLEIVALLGGVEPAARWTWRRQLAGAAVVVVTTVVVTVLL